MNSENQLSDHKIMKILEYGGAANLTLTVLFSMLVSQNKTNKDFNKNSKTIKNKNKM